MLITAPADSRQYCQFCARPPLPTRPRAHFPLSFMDWYATIPASRISRRFTSFHLSLRFMCVQSPLVRLFLPVALPPDTCATTQILGVVERHILLGLLRTQLDLWATHCSCFYMSTSAAPVRIFGESRSTNPFLIYWDSARHRLRWQIKASYTELAR